MEHLLSETQDGLSIMNQYQIPDQVQLPISEQDHLSVVNQYSTLGQESLPISQQDQFSNSRHFAPTASSSIPSLDPNLPMQINPSSSAPDQANKVFNRNDYRPNHPNYWGRPATGRRISRTPSNDQARIFPPSSSVSTRTSTNGGVASSAQPRSSDLNLNLEGTEMSGHAMGNEQLAAIEQQLKKIFAVLEGPAPNESASNADRPEIMDSLRSSLKSLGTIDHAAVSRSQLERFSSLDPDTKITKEHPKRCEFIGEDGQKCNSKPFTNIHRYKYVLFSSDTYFLPPLLTTRTASIGSATCKFMAVRLKAVQSFRARSTTGYATNKVPT